MSGRKGKKVSFYYPKNIKGVNLPEGSGISNTKKRQVRLARLSDAILGRKATVALGNTTVEIARGASQAIGMIIGDPHMRERSELRDLVPIKLLISARVHRLSFSHPSLNINAVLHDTGRKSTRKNGKRSGKEISTSNHESYRNSMTSLVRAEQHRLSRDGIIEGTVSPHFRFQVNGCVPCYMFDAIMSNLCILVYTRHLNFLSKITLLVGKAVGSRVGSLPIIISRSLKGFDG
jgi:hypothetical protein